MKQNQKIIRAHRVISDPVLHDVIKAVLHYYPQECFEICSDIPILKKSNLFTKGFWSFDKSMEEFLNERYRQHDVLWIFCSTEYNYDYQITHEVKTGRYDIEEVSKKYYLGSQSQIWIWAWQSVNKDTTPQNPKEILRNGRIKLLDLEYLLPVIIPKVSEIYNRLLEG